MGPRRSLAHAGSATVVHVYEVGGIGERGEAGGQVFIAMEFVRGPKYQPK